MAIGNLLRGEDVSGESAVLEVAIGPGLGLGTFNVEVVRSPAGEASVEVALPTEMLLARLPEVQSAVLLSALSARRVLHETERTVREIGEVLFDALLGSGEVAGTYRASVAVAAEREQALRVVLRIGDPQLAALPWETMYDRATGGYVCRHEQLVRHVPVALEPMPITVDPPLRILGVISSPRGLDALDTDKERGLLETALARLVSDGLAQLTWASDASWAGLHETLLAGPWHVVHFIGHGDFDTEADEGVLALVRQDGRQDLVEASRFADLLRQARPMPRLVVLNSCSGAAAGTGDLFAGTAAALTRARVPAVTAMQFAISDAAAAAFARGFYTALAHGRGVDDAVSAGRIAILGTSRRTLEWVTPVLYLRGHHARLFTGLPTSVRPGVTGVASREPAHSGTAVGRVTGPAEPSQATDALPARAGKVPARLRVEKWPGISSFRFAVRSDVGFIRPANQDSAYAGPCLLAVADGGGGDEVGGDASAAVISAFMPLDQRPTRTSDLIDALVAATEAASKSLRDLRRSGRARSGARSTLTAMLWSGLEVGIGHVGNSRAYLLRSDDLYQMTRDHTAAASLVDQGALSYDTMAGDPRNLELLRSLDGQTDSTLDLSLFTSTIGDRLLLCTDGLPVVVSNETILQVLADVTELDDAAEQLISLAIRSGGPDNITCIVADVIDKSSSGISAGQRPKTAGVIVSNKHFKSARQP